MEATGRLLPPEPPPWSLWLFLPEPAPPPAALWLAWGGAVTAHSGLTLVLQECSTTLKRSGSCSKGTFTIFPGDKVGKQS